MCRASGMLSPTASRIRASPPNLRPDRRFSHNIAMRLPTRRAPRHWRLPAVNPWMTLAVAFVVHLCLLPVIFHPWDILTCWLPWAQASHGIYPWDIYRRCPLCDYPVFWPYLLTILERIRLTLHL